VSNGTKFPETASLLWSEQPELSRHHAKLGLQKKSFGCLAGAGPTYIGLLSLFVHLHLFIFIYQKGREEK